MADFEKEWLEQWKCATQELESVWQRELRSLSEADAVRMFNQLDAPRPYPLRRGSGLTDQQRFFMKSLGGRIG